MAEKVWPRTPPKARRGLCSCNPHSINLLKHGRSGEASNSLHSKPVKACYFDTNCEQERTKVTKKVRHLFSVPSLTSFPPVYFLVAATGRANASCSKFREFSCRSWRKSVATNGTKTTKSKHDDFIVRSLCPWCPLWFIEISRRGYLTSMYSFDVDLRNWVSRKVFEGLQHRRFQVVMHRGCLLFVFDGMKDMGRSIQKYVLLIIRVFDHQKEGGGWSWGKLKGLVIWHQRIYLT